MITKYHKKCHNLDIIEIHNYIPGTQRSSNSKNPLKISKNDFLFFILSLVLVIKQLQAKTNSGIRRVNNFEIFLQLLRRCCNKHTVIITNMNITWILPIHRNICAQ